METKNAKKIEKNFICNSCDFICSKQSEWTRHIARPKHKYGAENIKKTPKNAAYICSTCNKQYKYNSGLWKHQKTCTNLSDPEHNIVQLLIKENTDFKNVMLDLVKSNTDLQKQMLDVCKNSNNTTINSHNKTFNLHFFLNEQCKDAMNIMDFVDSFTLQLSDLESVSKEGYVDGISNIIMKKLNEMDVYKRPIHCSDAKREIMYVKDQNKWEKEDAGYAKLRKAIKYISKKNSDLLFQWSDAHPASKNITSQTNTEYMLMIMQAMGGKGEIVENENKIIKKIAKTVLIDKL
jgi:hypothetical protein